MWVSGVHSCNPSPAALTDGIPGRQQLQRRLVAQQWVLQLAQLRARPPARLVQARGADRPWRARSARRCFPLLFPISVVVMTSSAAHGIFVVVGMRMQAASELQELVDGAVHGPRGVHRPQAIQQAVLRGRQRWLATKLLH